MHRNDDHRDDKTHLHQRPKHDILQMLCGSKNHNNPQTGQRDDDETCGHEDKSHDFNEMDHQRRKRKNQSFVTIQAPMVRYSRLPFRLLCQRLGTQVSYTPMIMSNSFSRSDHARMNDFTTNEEEFQNPLIVQFGANNAVEFAEAAKFVLPFCDAVDLNCGCPQKWAIHENIGAQLLQTQENIELIVDMLKTYHNCASSNDLVPMCVKIRKLNDQKKTYDLVKQLESTGLCAWLSVHGRTIYDRSDAVSVDADIVQFVKQSVSIPVVFNGDVFNMAQARQFAEYTNVDGIMSARGLLTNPALFSTDFELERDERRARLTSIKEFIDIVTEYGDPSLTFTHVHNHIMFMLNGYETKDKSLISSSDASELAEACSMSGIIDFLTERNMLPSV